MTIVRLVIAIGVGIAVCGSLLSCTERHPAQVEQQRTFLFVSRFIDPPESLYVRTDVPAVIEAVRKQLDLPEPDRGKILVGRLARGRMVYNPRWSWHMSEREWAVADVAIELCDARPSDVESDLDYWMGLGSFCPWDMYVKAEVLLR